MLMPYGRRGGLMVKALVSGSSALAETLCCVIGQHTQLS